jgi:hypothetical protein
VTRPDISNLIQPAGSLSTEQIQQIQTARQSNGKIRRAIFTAKFDGWTIGIFGVITLLVAFGGAGLTTLLAGLVMTLVGFVELRAAGMLSRLQENALKILAWNQVGFAILLILYALWGIYGEASGKAAAARSAEMSSLVGGADLGIGDLGPTISQFMYLFYGLIILEGLLVQGGMALYYIRRKEPLRVYLAETPPWIIAMQNAGMRL